MRSVLKEVKRLLKPGGIFMSITFAQPHFRHAVIISSLPVFRGVYYAKCYGRGTGDGH